MKIVFLAVDECDFGNSIELGIDLFCYGAPELHSTLLRLLVNGYTMIDRPQFIAIIKVSIFLICFIQFEFIVLNKSSGTFGAQTARNKFKHFIAMEVNLPCFVFRFNFLA